MTGAPVLAHRRVTAGEAAPGRWIYFLHGIYGAGRNWGSVARSLCEARPEWGAVLVDLRLHGDSRGFAPPHTLAACAGDLVRLGEELRPERGGPEAVLGHSFGGKVALQYLREAAPRPPRQLWIVDCPPGPREPGGTAWRMLGVLRRRSGPFADRDAAIRALREEGLEPAVAAWMATNLERGEGGMTWRLDPDALEELLRDFFAADLWAPIESPPPGCSIHLLKAEDSEALGPEDVERISRLAARWRPDDRPVALHVVPGGHWLNADNPGALVDLLAASLPTV